MAEPVWPSRGDHEDWELYLVALDATSIFLRLKAEEHEVGALEDGAEAA